MPSRSSPSLSDTYTARFSLVRTHILVLRQWKQVFCTDWVCFCTLRLSVGGSLRVSVPEEHLHQPLKPVPSNICTLFRFQELATEDQENDLGTIVIRGNAIVMMECKQHVGRTVYNPKTR